ncbi:hypothetical protein GBA52_008510 [Prunus armeniaca]|nr:hypothetical protein GBA52_008510 [Prunus armeniaca]
MHEHYKTCGTPEAGRSNLPHPSSLCNARPDEMKKMQDEIREKLIQEAAKGTAPDTIQVPLDAELGIMGEKIGRRGRSIHGVGVFLSMETSRSSTSSSTASSSK